MLMRCKFPSLAAAVALALGASAANAASVDDMFSIRGFGTAGVLYTDMDQADFVRDVWAQDEGVGRSHSIGLNVDSKTAVQLDARFTDRFSAVVQLVSESLYNNSWSDDTTKLWRPSLEWANLSYRVTENFTVRGGRIVMPFLMNAEFKKVGYANPWMHAPVELYGAMPFSSVDGGDMTYKRAFGSGINTTRAYYGTSKFRPESSVTDATIYGVLDTYEVGSFTVRASFSHQEFENLNADPSSVPQLLGLASTLFAPFPDAASTLNLLARASTPGFKFKGDYYALGSSYDPGKWFVMGEVLKTNGPTIPEFVSAYVNGGVRIDKWTPYATYSMMDAKRSFASLPADGYGTDPLGQMAAGVAAQLNASVEAQNVIQDQRTLSLGLRWDVVSNLALKAQFDHIMVPNDSKGMFVNTVDLAQYQYGKDANVFGLSVDFLF